MIDPDEIDKPWKDKHPKLTSVGSVLGIITIINAVIRLWNNIQRARDRKKERDKETK